jgi:hypothetical protein
MQLWLELAQDSSNWNSSDGFNWFDIKGLHQLKLYRESREEILFQCLSLIYSTVEYILIFLRRKVPGQTGARTRDLRQNRLALNTNALTLWARDDWEMLPYGQSYVTHVNFVTFCRKTRHRQNKTNWIITTEMEFPIFLNRLCNFLKNKAP